MDQEEQPATGMESGQPGTRAATAPQEDTQPPSPKQPLLILENSNDAGVDTMDTLDASLNPLTTEVKTVVVEDGMELDLSGLGPDLDQVDSTDPIVGGPLLDQTVDVDEDQFSKPS